MKNKLNLITIVVMLWSSLDLLYTFKNFIYNFLSIKHTYIYYIHILTTYIYFFIITIIKININHLFIIIQVNNKLKNDWEILNKGIKLQSRGHSVRIMSIAINYFFQFALYHHLAFKFARKLYWSYVVYRRKLI